MKRYLVKKNCEEKILLNCQRYNYELIEPFVYVTKQSRVKLKCLKDVQMWV